MVTASQLLVVVTTMVMCHLSSLCPQHRRDEFNTHKKLVMAPRYQEIFLSESLVIAAGMLNLNYPSPAAPWPHGGL